MDKPEISCAQVRLFGRQKEEEHFQHFVYVNNKLDEFVYHLDVMNSVYDEVIANQPFVMFHKKYLQLVTLIIYSFRSSQDELKQWR